ncbi:hypothetical protein BS47DRAFT_1360943 [Hydnum rufescens UP504]|uniref:Uncharacterized protein n=1 Tax=Hydnum rufescens UP504 TaxID=1448309 RepID=A0A9P6DUL3_9AGAM|nr:hypothetical protein BS47DRAFT_1360943 [Hydnum rufescens UP504]
MSQILDLLTVQNTGYKPPHSVRDLGPMCKDKPEDGIKRNVICTSEFSQGQMIEPVIQHLERLASINMSKGSTNGNKVMELQHVVTKLIRAPMAHRVGINAIFGNSSQDMTGDDLMRTHPSFIIAQNHCKDRSQDMLPMSPITQLPLQLIESMVPLYNATKLIMVPMAHEASIGMVFRDNIPEFEMRSSWFLPSVVIVSTTAAGKDERTLKDCYLQAEWSNDVASPPPQMDMMQQNGF